MVRVIAPLIGAITVTQFSHHRNLIFHHCYQINPGTYANKVNATPGAKSALEKMKRNVSTFSPSLARARPELFPELPVNVTGWKPAIDGTDWRIAKITHRLANSGFISELELRLEEDGDGESGGGNSKAEAPDDAN